MFHTAGIDFIDSDNRILSLKLVKKGLTNATMFDAQHRVLQPKEALYKKDILILRGRFRPATLVNMDMLDQGLKNFKNDIGTNRKPYAVMELTLHDLQMEKEGIDEQDFLDRADLLSDLGQTVMISNYSQYYKLIMYLRMITKGKYWSSYGCA